MTELGRCVGDYVAGCPQNSTKMPLLGMAPEEEEKEETVTPTL